MPEGRSVAIHCEALKVSYRQTREGMVVAFAIKPEDMPPELALAPVGTRVMLAVAEIVPEEERASQPPPAPAGSTLASRAAARPEENARPGALDTTKSSASERGKDSYRLADAMQKAVTRASLLCKDERFIAWIGALSEQDAITTLRGRLGIKSRSEIASNEDVFQRYLDIEYQFQHRDDPPQS